MLDKDCSLEDACDYVTIPHNSNLSNGRLLRPYASMDATNEERREYASKRLQREPLMEIFQHKGNSECFNGLAAVLGEPDELCNFESVRTLGEKRTAVRIKLEDGKLVTETAEVVSRDCGTGTGADGMLGSGCISKNDFLRSALLTGLEEEQALGINPLKLGVIASTDTHMSTPGAVSETNWGGHVSKESTAEERLEPGLLPTGIVSNPGGLAGIWAVENSRDAIFDALERREVFGTSGPRIVPRFFAGWDYADGLCDNSNMLEQAYAYGVPMGGDLAAQKNADAPVFIASAYRDPHASAADLQQLQIIKGWIDAEGNNRYKVYTVAGSPDNGAGVDPETGERKGEGHASLCKVFRDPEFNPQQHAYYYMRAVENPSPRWSLLDCLRIAEGKRPAACSNPTIPKVIQEMAWTSAIWYRPSPQ